MAPRPHTKQVQASPQAERSQHPALTKAIAEAAMEAAETDSISGPTFYKVDEILIEVRPNPGPTAYKVTIVPA
jgi:hypothetical protein